MSVRLSDLSSFVLSLTAALALSAACIVSAVAPAAAMASVPTTVA